MPVLMLMSMLMSHASVDLFVLSFVLPCAYAYVASENQALNSTYSATLLQFSCFKQYLLCNITERSMLCRHGIQENMQLFRNSPPSV